MIPTKKPLALLMLVAWPIICSEGGTHPSSPSLSSPAQVVPVTPISSAEELTTPRFSPEPSPESGDSAASTPTDNVPQENHATELARLEERLQIALDRLRRNPYYRNVFRYN